jgi:protoporphyrin/coproporphyrin ferrochelatase
LRARLGPEVPVAAGMRNWHPFIKDALARLAAAGVTRVIGIPMAPQFSTLSVQKYIDAANAALPAGVQFEAVESFHTHPLLLDAFSERVRAAQPKADEAIIFTAHALPVRVIEAGDRYADEVAETAAGVASRAGIAKYDCAFQSAGRTPEPWIGPDLAQVIDDRSVNIRRFLVVPIGFVCDHTEILFDIDVEASRIAREFSTTLRRTESLNTSPLFISTLEDLVRARL